jgi:hypothetical protein
LISSLTCSNARRLSVTAMDVLLFESLRIRFPSLRTGMLILPRTAPRSRQSWTHGAMTVINFRSRFVRLLPITASLSLMDANAGRGGRC